MHGILLAGGTGSRLGPLTKVVNKHLLPVHELPMIVYPLKTLMACGVGNILIVSGREHIGQLAGLLGSGAEYGCRLSYRVQEKPGGIAEALMVGNDFTRSSHIAVILGDNIFLPAPEIPTLPVGAAHVFLSKVKDARPFGVAKLNGDLITSIIEKPQEPPSDLAVTGLYVFPWTVFRDMREARYAASARGELEITDVLNMYCPSALSWSIVDGYWGDAGTVDGIAEATEAVIAYKAALHAKGEA